MFQSREHRRGYFSYNVEGSRHFVLPINAFGALKRIHNNNNNSSSNRTTTYASRKTNHTDSTVVVAIVKPTLSHVTKSNNKRILYEDFSFTNGVTY